MATPRDFQGVSFGGLSTFRAVVSFLSFSLFFFSVSQGCINFFSLPDGLRHLCGVRS
jgi:hypothetical protein